MNLHPTLCVNAEQHLREERQPVPPQSNKVITALINAATHTAALYLRLLSYIIPALEQISPFAEKKCR